MTQLQNGHSYRQTHFRINSNMINDDKNIHAADTKQIQNIFQMTLQTAQMTTETTR